MLSKPILIRLRITRLRYTRWGRSRFCLSVLFSTVPAGVFVTRVFRVWASVIVASKQRRVYSACTIGVYVQREYARTRRVIKVFSTGPAGPDLAATAAAVATSSRLGRLAQSLQADLPGPEQSADSHGDREILVRTRQRRRRRRMSRRRLVRFAESHRWLGYLTWRLIFC